MNNYKLGWFEAASLVSDACLEVAGDALGLGDDGGSMLGRHDLFCCLLEEGEPARKVAGFERKRDLKVSHHWIAFVAARCEHDGRPEVFEFGEMFRPVFDEGVEDGADFGIELNFGVETIDQVADLFFGNFLGAHNV